MVSWFRLFIDDSQRKCGTKNGFHKHEQRVELCALFVRAMLFNCYILSSVDLCWKRRSMLRNSNKSHSNRDILLRYEIGVMRLKLSSDSVPPRHLSLRQMASCHCGLNTTQFVPDIDGIVVAKWYTQTIMRSSKKNRIHDYLTSWIACAAKCFWKL